LEMWGRKWNLVIRGIEGEKDWIEGLGKQRC
jgi:hypothetical protein